MMRIEIFPIFSVLVITTTRVVDPYPAVSGCIGPIFFFCLSFYFFFWSVELGQTILEVKDYELYLFPVGSGSGFLKCRIQINNSVITPDIYFFFIPTSIDWVLEIF